jgi:hypothetical protein
MALNNPWAGGPDYVVALGNAIDKVPNAYARPPASGGTQISLRIAEDRLAVLDELCVKSKWNRNQVVNALIDKGLFLVFHQLSSAKVDEIMTNVGNTRAPTFDTAGASFDLVASFNRFRLRPVPLLIVRKRKKHFDPTWVLNNQDRERQVVQLSEPSGYSVPLHLNVLKEIIPDSITDARNDGFRNAILNLNVQLILERYEARLEPYP